MKHWSDVVSGLGTVGISLLSCAICPLCLPFYAGLLSVIGFELGYVHELFEPLIFVFALITLGLMANQIYRHQGNWMPFKVALGSALGIGIATINGYDYVLYICLALFMGSIVWNKRSLIHTKHSCC